MKKILLCCFCFLSIFLLDAQTKVESVAAPPLTKVNSFYTGNRAPLQPQPFIKLPVGKIKAGGWIAKCLDLQNNGLMGHLNEISIWLDKTNNAWIDKNETSKKGWEEVPYWLRGYSAAAYLTGDAAMIDKSKVWIEAMLSKQDSTGFFGPKIIRDNGKIDMWANMLVLYILQDYYDYTGDKRIISFMTSYFKWEMSVPDKDLLGTYWDTSRGGDNLNSILWLYNITGDSWLLKLADKIHKATMDLTQPDRLPNWHNVNVAQSFREPATYFMVTGDSSFLKATYNDYNMIRNIYGQVPGGMYGSDENCRPGYSDPRQGTETCGFVEQMNSDEMLLSITGDPLWAENCENVAFNSYPAALMPDFKSLRYLTCPNMPVSDSKDHFPGFDNKGPFLVMNPLSNRCCQHNHSFGWPYYVKSLWMATPDNGLAAVLFNNCEVTAKAGSGSEVKIKETTNYPFEEKISFIVSMNKADTFPLYFRIPEWCKKPVIKINGKPAEGTIEPGKYARITRIWKDNDRVELDLPMSLNVKTWNENKNSVSINYGPLTFSLLIKEDYVKVDGKKTAVSDARWLDNVDTEKWPSYEIHARSPWNYGLLKPHNLEKQFTIERRQWPADNYPFTQESAPIIIKTKGRIIPQWKIDDTGICGVLPKSPVSTNEKTQNITLIPMGAARLRITSFPVVSSGK